MTAGATEGFAVCVTVGVTAGVSAGFTVGVTAGDTDGDTDEAGEYDGVATGVVAGFTVGSNDALAIGLASTGDDVGAGGSSGNDNIDAIGDEFIILLDEIIELSSGA